MKKRRQNIINTIRDTVLNEHLVKILATCQNAGSPTVRWQTKTFLNCLMQDDRFNDINYDALLMELFERIKEYLVVSFSPSASRGRLNGFIHTTRKAIEKVRIGQKIEVPLGRALALKNGWHCELSLLSGYNKEPHSGKRSSIDLVVQSSESEGFLIELKRWGCRQHILFVAIEIIINWFCFILVRNMDISAGRDQGDQWPKFNKFKLRVMAPEDFFRSHPLEYRRLMSLLDSALKTFCRSLASQYDVESCELGIEELRFSEQDFINLVLANATVLISKSSRPEELNDNDILHITM
jgi:hypothetical protein